MVLDLRAQILCNLGPVISGSIRDDHIQGQGLIYTTGDLVIAGLITPAHGTEVKLAYVTPDGDRVARFPRGLFKVTQAFANPLSNQTELQIANELAFQKGKGGGTVNSALVDALNGRLPKLATALDLREALVLLASRCGITLGNLGSWSLPKQIPALESPDYIETISDILASVGRYGYLDADNVLQVQSYGELSLGGPVVTFDKVLDLNPNAGGLDFTEAPVGSGEAQQIEGDKPKPLNTVYTDGFMVENGTYGQFGASWDASSLSTTTTIKVSYYDQTSDTFAVTETVATAELTAEPDNRVIERRTDKTEQLVKINSQIVQDYINAAKKKDLAGQDGAAEALRQTAMQLANVRITCGKTEIYEFQEIPPPPLSDEEQQQIDQEIDSAIQSLESGPLYSNPSGGDTMRITLLPKLPTYRKTREESREQMSFEEALGRIGVPDYSKLGGIPSGKGLKELTQIDYAYSGTTVKEFKRVFVAYGLTQMGQQALAAAATKIKQDASFNYNLLLQQFFTLVLEDHLITTRDEFDDNDPKPVPDYLAPVQASEVVIQGGSRIQVGNNNAQRSNKANSFGVPFLPDDVVNDDGSISKGNAETAAARYAEEQNLLLLGHRLGLQVTTALGQLPTPPLAAFHLSNNGLTATYRSNGTSWAFDANSCIVSTDALYWGLAGGDINGPRWTPVAPGTTALPVPPAVVNNGSQPPLNSAVLNDPVDESDSGAIATLIDSLPTNGAEVFAVQQTPVSLATAYKLIRETTLQVRLELESKLVPLGITRNMGAAELQLRTQLEAVQEISPQVRSLVETTERRLLVETFSAGLGLGGNLS